MVKRSKKQIDQDEKKVIMELQKNAKESIDRIAKKCGFSRQKVWRIIKRLEKNKTIWGYYAVADDDKLNVNSYLVLLKKTTQPVEKLADIIISRDIETKAKSIGVSIDSSNYLHGSFDWEICFSAKDIKQAKKFCELLNRTYKNYIQELHLLERIFTVKRCGLHNPNLTKLKEFV
jgi:DNA-binding Lrp family transcriptional regulator